MSKFRIFLFVLMLVGLFGFAGFARPEAVHADAVTLTNGTATYSQELYCCNLNVDEAVDGQLYDYGASGTFNGWAIYDGASSDQTAVWETTSDIDASRLDFTLYHTWGGFSNLGRFRLSYTTDDRSTFADGLNSYGDITANWTVLTGAVASGTGGETFTVLGDNSILVSGNNPETTIYSVSFEGNFSGITGIRLEALSDTSLPDNGASRGANGNWHLVEITLDATPPSPNGPPTAGLIGHWKFDGDATDSSGNGNDGTAVNGPDYAADVPAAIQSGNPQSIGFNGSNQHVEIPGAASLKPSNLTVSIWAKSTTSTWNDYGWMINFEPTGGAPGYIIHPNWNSTSVTVFVGDSTTNKTATCTPTNITDWHNYAFTLDNNALRFYIDGVECNSTSTIGFNIAYPAGQIFVGKDPCCGGTRYGNGRVDELRIYDRALSPTEVALLSSPIVVDSDGDGVPDDQDVCPFDPDNDIDGDGVCGDVDNAPNVPNANQLDSDGDGVGDVADVCPFDPDDDIDGDGVCGDVDNAPNVPNANQLDSDGDGVGDVADVCPFDPDDDIDGDGVCGDVDNAPNVPNANQLDSDGDGVGDVADVCPFDPDDDIDGDGVCGDVDNAPNVPNADQLDSDGDGVGDVADAFPNDPSETADTDGDGVGDNADAFPNDPDRTVSCSLGYYGATDCTPAPLGTYVDTAGALTATPCPVGTFSAQLGAIACTAAPIGTYVGFAGAAEATNCPAGTSTESIASTSENDCLIDTDGDGRPDTIDADDDGDGVPDANDAFPTDPTETADSDGDGVGDNSDAFPNDAGETADTDGDGVGDNSDNCAVANGGQADSNNDGQGDACDPVITAVTGQVEPVALNDQPVTVSATFEDADDGDNHTAVIDWGDGNSDPGAVDQGNNSAGGTHSYAEPGVYAVTVTVTDDYGPEAWDSEVYKYVVIYDPSAGFVTGGGWILSPAGAMPGNPDAKGKAEFGFVAKYKKGATVPSGNTEFQFEAGEFHFHSTSYEWLVVAGAKAQFKGEGRVEGSNHRYGFMLTATDSQINGGGNVDKFRLKVWDMDNGSGVVYDNQIGGADTDDPTTAISKGSIVIHKR